MIVRSLPTLATPYKLYICIRARMHVYSLYVAHVCIHAYIHTYLHTYMHTYIHTCIYTCIPIYIHKYIHTHVNKIWKNWKIWPPFFLKYLEMATHIYKYNKDQSIGTGWRRLIGSPKLQLIFHKRATKYRSLLQKMTYKDKGSYESSPPSTIFATSNDT